MTADLTYTITVETLYGKPYHELTPPPRCKFTGEFRVPRVTEYYLEGMNVYTCGQNIHRTPRLILVATPIRKRYVFEETGEVRRVKHGDWFVNSDPACAGSITLWNGFDSAGTYPILTQRVEEVNE